ncbi:MAG: sigma 54-interacting transcriptional regulator [Desulfarculus sp.]|nr:sigma 54-interacting transcriptional regulator [Desulfarculus sp.]
MLELILNHIHNGVVVTDASGIITHFNEPYGRFLGVDPKAQIGRHTTEVVENTRMHIVAQTGVAEINWPHRIRGQDMVVQRIPVVKNGKVIAVFGQVMFKDVGDVRKLARKLKVLESKVKLYEEELISLRSTRYTIDSIVGRSPALAALKKEALWAATNRLPVLVTGESGTGKELFAQAIHHAGKSRPHPFVRINCATIPKDLFESELFGYADGAFTGARAQGKPGKFELAHHGTVFLDEIGELPLAMQPKLLRVLEEKEFERVGGTSLIKTDFRLIAATNQNLDQMMASGGFRKDLYYRLNVIPLHIPPLRERTEDIPPLAECLLAQIGPGAGGQAISLTPEALEVLLAYHWPGNVRELFNALERSVASIEDNLVTVANLPFHLHRPTAQPARQASGRLKLKQVAARSEAEALRQALAACGGNKTQAASLLGIHRTLLYRKMKKLGLDI